MKISTSTKVTTKIITSTAVLIKILDETTTSIIYTTTNLSPTTTCSTFSLQVASGTLAGRYAYLYQTSTPDDNALSFDGSLTDFEAFRYAFTLGTTDGSLHVGNTYGGIQSSNPPGGALLFYGPSKINSDFIGLSCATGVDDILSCSAQGATIFQICGSYGPNLGADVGIGTTLGDNCKLLTFKAVGISSC